MQLSDPVQQQSTVLPGGTSSEAQQMQHIAQPAAIVKRMQLSEPVQQQSTVLPGGTSTEALQMQHMAQPAAQ
jgi:hypothetical protein